MCVRIRRWLTVGFSVNGVDDEFCNITALRVLIEKLTRSSVMNFFVDRYRRIEDE